MPSNQLDIETTQDFKRFLEYEQAEVKGSQTLKYTLEYITKPNVKILDIGGASGVLLDEIIKQSNYPVSASLLEVNPIYQKYLANKKITFIPQSILDNDLKDQSYDIVVFRHVLHHLIGKDIAQTTKNQEKMLSEIFRITKKGGLILFEEEVNNNLFSSKIIFYISQLAVKLHIHIKQLEIGKVIVRFMSQKEIEGYVSKTTIVKKEFIPWHLNGVLKWTQLMNNVGSLFLIIRN